MLGLALAMALALAQALALVKAASEASVNLQCPFHVSRAVYAHVVRWHS